MHVNISKIFWLFAISILIIIILPFLIQEGMFVDGVTYSALSKNLAHDIGSPWAPRFDNIISPPFYSHPPLVFIIQSYFFKLFGDGFYTERIYNFCLVLLTIYGMLLFWRLMNAAHDIQKMGWLLIFVWMCIPLASWTFKNNMLENTVSVLVLFSSYFLIYGILKNKFFSLFPASICLLAAFYSKGFVGLFPLVIPLLYLIVYQPKEKNYAFLFQFGILLLPALGFFYFYATVPEIKLNLQEYIKIQLIPALNNESNIVAPTDRMHIMMDLISDTIFLVLCLLLIRYFNKKEKFIIPTQFIKNAIFFCCIGLLASVPLMVTLKQRKFYLVPSLPFFVLAFSFIFAPSLVRYLKKISNTTASRLYKISILIFVGSLIYSFTCIGKFSRDENILKDVYQIAKILPNHSALSCPRHLWSDWISNAYLLRIGVLSLDPNNQNAFYLTYKNEILPPTHSNYIKVQIPLRTFDLYQLK